VRENAAEKLLEFGEKAIPVFVGELDNPDSQMRAWALLNLGRLKDKAIPIFNAILKRLDDPELFVRQAAASALYLIGSSNKWVIPNIVSALVTKLRNEDPEMMIHVIGILIELGKKEAVLSNLSTLLDLTDVIDPKIRKSAALSLVRLGGRAVPFLVQKLE